jgi:methanogenic corrinoid protein MtbC1
MPYAEEETQRIQSWTQHIQIGDMRNLAEEALRRVASRSTAKIYTMSSQDMPFQGGAGRHEIAELCATLLGDDFEAAELAVFALLKRGISLEDVYHDYLGASAIRLGEMWTDDQIDFMQVTRGVARIIVLMRNLRERADLPRITHAAPILFATVPGEIHALGVTMARDLLRDRGWDVVLLTGLDHDQLVDQISTTDARVLGLSCGSPATAGALARVILAVRLMRPTLPILVSGQVVNSHLDLVSAIAPDSAVTSIDMAISEIERLTGPLERPVQDARQ